MHSNAVSDELRGLGGYEFDVLKLVLRAEGVSRFSCRFEFDAVRLGTRNVGSDEAANWSRESLVERSARAAGDISVIVEKLRLVDVLWNENLRGSSCYVAGAQIVACLSISTHPVSSLGPDLVTALRNLA